MARNLVTSMTLNHHAIGRVLLEAQAAAAGNLSRLREIEEALCLVFEGPEHLRGRELQNSLKIPKEEIDCQVSDRVMIVKSLSAFLPDLIKSGFFIIDETALAFARSGYPELCKLPHHANLNQITSGKALDQTIKQVIQSEAACLVGFGGGRTLDIMKFIGWKSGLPMLAIPSSLATHVYASSKIHCLPVIRDLGHDLTLEGIAPHRAILDTKLLAALFMQDQRLVFAGFGDVMAFLNSQQDWRFACEQGEDTGNTFVDEMISWVIRQLHEIPVEKPFVQWIQSYAAIQVMLCLITDWAGSAPASGAEHLFAKCIEDKTTSPLLHGEMVALGTLIFSFIRNSNVQEVLSLLDKFHLPRSLSSLGIELSRLVEALMDAQQEGRRKKRFTISETLPVNAGYYQKILHNMIEEQLLCF